MAEIERVMLGDDLVAVAISGEMDMADESRADLAIDVVIGLEARGALLDLTRCGFIDVSGLRLLLRASERMLRAGIRVAVAGPGPPGVRRILDLTGVSSELAMFDNRDQAIAALMAGSPSVRPGARAAG
jgi:anti-sigma B factor antagonist